MTTVPDFLAAALSKHYALRREIGRGGMATVYLAHDCKHDRLVALKVLRPELSHVLGRERFGEEVRIIARLQHPHILPLFDSGEAASQLWYTMPYVEGESLRQRLEREGQLSIEEALRISQNVLAALAYAHQHGIIHRDLKPDNILLESGEAVVSDFGIAHAVDAAGGDRLTASGLALGTPTYMSPEQAAGSTVDGRSDIYSLGCVIYEMLAGEPPFTGPSPRAVVARHSIDPVPPLQTVRPTVPRNLQRAVEKALAKVPADRFGTAAEFASALAVNPAGASAERNSTLLTSSRAVGAVPKRRVLGYFAGVLALLGAGALAVSRSHRSPAATLDPDRIVVVPFAAVNPPLRNLGEGLVEYLSRSLDGAGTLRTVSPSAYLRRWGGQADASGARALSGRTGAGLVVYGELAMISRDSVRLRGALLDPQSSTAPAEFELQGDTARIDLLGDSLTIAVLRTIGRTRPVGVVRSTPFSRASIPALKEFLRGEHFYRRSHWDSALSHYDRSIALDSGFALPYRRMTLVLGWHSPASSRYQSDRSYAMLAARLNHGLAPRDSLLITADSLFYVPSGPNYFRDRHRLFATLEEAAQRYPGDPEIWLAMGEARIHDGTAYFWGWGEKSPAQMLDAFDRAIALDSGFTPAYEHTAELALMLGKPELALRYVRARATAAGNEAVPQARLLGLLLDSIPDGTQEVSRLIETASVGRLWTIAGALRWLGDSNETAIRVLRSLVYGDHALNADAFRHIEDSLLRRRGLAVTLAYRGHLREAYLTFPKPESAHPNPFTDLALLGFVAPESAVSYFDRLRQDRSAWAQNDGTGPVPIPTGPRQALAWWFARRDTAALGQLMRGAAARVELDPIRRAHLEYLSATARAYLTLVGADSTTALREFSALPDSLCLLDTCFFERLTYARLLAAQGKDSEAGELLDRWLWSRTWSPYFILGTLERGRIAERLDDRQKAVRSYRLVIDTWRRPDRELLPYVTEARAGLERLGKDSAN